MDEEDLGVEQINPDKWIKYFDLAKTFLEGNNK
jgi:hypothetical protein